MKVGDYKIGAAKLPIEGRRASMMPVRPAIKNWNKKPIQNNIGVLN